ncbi:type II secretion system F family protein [Stutzerimonas kirkiae]|uniref:type II secretion system F family protein n=1 Tax=Stutzerimonas kirkiae TaxID=2211392 RepID=UPI0010383B07|nr:type II secretion system F family protein [Stutzerimonas kirkiae]TBV07432.1 pilus assembly protein [Stutzerimonas kirkiae]TBV11065.1 pilus assembly protein [Stutzerimonas kirkiae]
MSRADIVMLATFLACVLLGLALGVLRDALRQRPAARIQQRLQGLLSESCDVSRQKILQELAQARAEARRRQRHQAMGSLGYYLNRLDTLGGRRGYRLLLVAAAGPLLGAVALMAFGWLPLNPWSIALALFAAPLLTAVAVYRKLLANFQLRFLDQLPEAMDSITRASQAGIPVTQSIRNVGAQFAAPLGPEFARMGHSLVLGNDIQNVMDEALLRIELPDFAFFAVCLALQRDTGGSLVEALGNLATIIRTRRDLRLKTRAMTAEGRLSGMILAALPFFIAGSLFLLSPDYVGVLFSSEAGQELLWLAAVMLALGVLSIQRIARLEV